MRIQFRWRGDYRSTFNDWNDWSASGMEYFADCEDNRLDVETRIVDDAGNVVAQTPAFIPAYYERVGTDGPGVLTWRTMPPAIGSMWIRRADVKPQART